MTRHIYFTILRLGEDDYRFQLNIDARVWVESKTIYDTKGRAKRGAVRFSEQLGIDCKWGAN